ncbi:hypothetical protein [Rathayibacter soli]|uniref:hypothetical protein n=1 Tax=Rathayibacter soli TaxID=3144168 RepID=UPI0027E3FC97|nr:hypothetical protein [Glaciibacter superstes]
MPPHSPRSREGRELAEQAFDKLLDACGDKWQELVLIGGLIPDTLVESSEPHQGTLDVDVLLSLALEYDRDDEDYSWLEAALKKAEFVKAKPNISWRWIVEVDQSPVIVEFLVDVPDNLESEINLPGTRDLTAMNLSGPGPALKDARVIELGGRLARAAGVGGYLTAKAGAIVRRDLRKDFYDFAFVVIHAVRAEGPDAVAMAVASACVPGLTVIRNPREDVISACHRFDGPHSNGARIYAAEARAAGSTTDIAALQAQAQGAIGAFLSAFERSDPQI